MLLEASDGTLWDIGSWFRWARGRLDSYVHLMCSGCLPGYISGPCLKDLEVEIVVLTVIFLYYLNTLKKGIYKQVENTTALDHTWLNQLLTNTVEQ